MTDKAKEYLIEAIIQKLNTLTYEQLSMVSREIDEHQIVNMILEEQELDDVN